MKKRYTVLGLSVVLALALAVPALGGPSNPIADVSATVKSTANKALKKAKNAEKTAKNALNTANSANSNANSANSEAKKAATAAAAAQATANTAKATADSAKGTADSAKAIAEEAKVRAEEGIRFSSLRIGLASPESGTNTTTTKNSDAECESDEFVLGGGFFVGGESDKVAVHTSNPQVIYSNGWFAEGSAISGTPAWSIQTTVMCGIR